jgi:hypothetical protein
MLSKEYSMKLDEAKKMFQGEWIAFRISKESENPEGDVLLHNKNHRELGKKILQKGIKDVYITFAGPAIPAGYTACF